MSPLLSVNKTPSHQWEALAQPLAEETPLQLSVNASGRLKTAEEFGNIVLHARQDTRTTLLKDVARIELAAENYAMRTYLDKKPAVALAIQESSGANALEIASRVSSTMEELKKQFPEGLDYQIVYNPTKSVRAGIEAVLHTL